MGDRNITLLELHTHGDTQFGPSSTPDMGSEDSPSPKEAASKAKSLFRKRTKGDEEDEETEIEVGSEDDSGGGSLGTLVMGLFILAAIAMVAKKVGGGKETQVDLTESDDR